MIQCLEPGDDLKTDPRGKPSVFDFGGWGDHRILTAATLCDLCVVPLYYQSTADMTACIKTIQTLQEYNKNIVILINNTQPSYILELKGFFKTNFPTFPVFVVNPSKYINRMADEGKTVSDLFELGRLHKYALRKLKPQLYSFYDYLDTFIK